jgi:GNAT superfamily N-acetyltransferase
VSRTGPAAWGITFRPATPDDIPACGQVWRDALNDYQGRLGQLPAGEDLAPIGRLHRHLQRTDPSGFCVAVREDRLIGFGAATRRGPVWYLSMLFVHPDFQGAGIGRTILERILPRDPEVILATGTDSAQPVSNALYARLGIVPRVPLLSIVGRPGNIEELPRLPAGIRSEPFPVAPGSTPAVDGSRVIGILSDLDLGAAGFDHPEDHAWVWSEGRQGFLYRDPDGRPVGYGYASPVGRVGPVAVRDAGLLAPVVGHLLAAVQPRGASALWVPGTAGSLVTALLRAGLRLEGFPVLLCWTRPFADLERYLPISPGLL